MALLFRSSVDSAARWCGALEPLLPGVEVRVWPEIGDPSEIEYALVWRPEPGLLARLPKLQLILSLGAGVDHLFRDPDLPRQVPIVRLVDPYMTETMSEYVALQVLRLHRRDPEYRIQQQARVWRELDHKNAAERPVGILGFGKLGEAAGRRLRALGFPVSGWSRRQKQVDGFNSFAGAEGLPRILQRSEILVCLLPLTSATRGILCAAHFALLPRHAGLVNAGRGEHLVEEDLIPALDAGQLSAATLDVFREEPLATDHPFWGDPRILVTPHVAALTNPATAAPIIAGHIRRFQNGEPLRNRVDPARGY